jgi:hypothetical protein
MDAAVSLRDNDEIATITKLKFRRAKNLHPVVLVVLVVWVHGS